MHQEKYADNLVHRNEKKYYALVLTISIIVYLLLIVSIFGIFIIGALLLVSLFFHAIMMGHIRTNAVKLSERQFPDIYQKTRELAAKMELPHVPDIYIVESGGTLNAFATRFFGRNMVIIYSEIFELYKKDGEDELSFVIAHELAHIKRRHISKMMFILPAMWMPGLGELYLRACEYTCDRYAAYYGGNTEAAQNSLTILAVGKNLYHDVNRIAYLDQIMHERGFFIWLSEVLSTHPPLQKRIREIGLFFQEEEYLAYSYKSGRKIWLWITASIVSLVILTVGGIYSVGKLAAFINTLEADGFIDDETEETPALIEAVVYGDIDEVTKLLDNGEKLDVKDTYGYSPLHWAVMDESQSMTYYLLNAGADPNQEDDYGLTPLMTAAERGNVEIVNLLLSADADPNYIDYDYSTPLIYAIYGENAEVVELLLQAGADPSLSDSEEMTPLMYAIQMGLLDIAEILRRNK